MKLGVVNRDTSPTPKGLNAKWLFKTFLGLKVLIFNTFGVEGKEGCLPLAVPGVMNIQRLRR
jgi:hypothetical protein